MQESEHEVTNVTSPVTENLSSIGSSLYVDFKFNFITGLNCIGVLNVALMRFDGKEGLLQTASL